MPSEIDNVVRQLEIACIVIFAGSLLICMSIYLASRVRSSLDASGRRAAQALWTMTTAFFYAYGIEHACVLFKTYRYPGSAFGLHIRGAHGVDVPLWIGMGWGTIVYFCTFTSTRLKLGRLAQPMAAGILALNIDLALDPIATHFGAWTWNPKLVEGYYGVPWQNFVGWFCIVTGFALVARLRLPLANAIKDRFCKGGKWKSHEELPSLVKIAVHTTTTLAVAVAAFALVGGALYLADQLYRYVSEVSTFAVIYTVALVMVVFKLGRLYEGAGRYPNYRPNWLVWAMPMTYHLIFIYIWGSTHFETKVGHVHYPIFLMAMLAGGLFGYPAIDTAVTIVRKVYGLSGPDKFRRFWSVLLADKEGEYDDGPDDYY